MMRIAICDDDKYIVKQLAEIIAKYEQQNNLQVVVDTFLSGIALLKSNIDYDLIFLDIDMPEMNGLEVAKKLREIGVISKIVYVTNHAHFTSQALSIHAFGYIVKPFEDKEVFLILDDFVKFSDIEALRKMTKKQKILIFENAKERVCLDAEKILYFEYCGNKGIKIVSIDESRYFHCTLHEALLKAKEYGFATSHQSFVVNFLYIKSINGEKLVMSNGDAVPLAQRRAHKFKHAHNLFLQEM